MFFMGCWAPHALMADDAKDNQQNAQAPSVCAERNPLRNLYFGDLHIHTSLSWDAYARGTRLTPYDAYRFAQGEAVATVNGATKLSRPLDFAAVTDHAEFLGEVTMCSAPGYPAYDSPFCKRLRAVPPNPLALPLTALPVGLPLIAPLYRNPSCGLNGRKCREALHSAWEEVKVAAESSNQPCRFTSFIAYEYTRAPLGNMLHRNVIFRNSQVPAMPISSFEAESPEKLWAALREDCLEAGNGCDVLAIPHNSNLSGGLAFSAISSKFAALRNMMEPLIEIYQHKGASECHFGFSNDEQCNFEEIVTRDCRKADGGQSLPQCATPNNYVRGVLALGMAEEERLGINPYRLGIIASTDTHLATPGQVEEAEFIGHSGFTDDSPEKRLASEGQIVRSPGGLAGVWATENTRDAIFDALKRRETFGTSGPRIAVRFFGGFDLPEDLCSRPDWLALANNSGVPMGGKLYRHAHETPIFMVFVGMDQTPLQRIQIIKVWAEGGEPKEEVADIAVTPEGSGQLCAMWRDPAPAPRSAYYARVLEMPSKRWSAYDCERLPPEQRPTICATEMTRTIQERAWTSPIWLSP